MMTVGWRRRRREGLDVPYRSPGDRAPLHGSHPEAARGHRPFSTLPDVVLLHQRERSRRRLENPRFPCRLLSRLRVRFSSHTGLSLRRDHGRRRPGPRHRERLLRQALAHTDAARCIAGRNANRRGRARLSAGRRRPHGRDADGRRRELWVFRHGRDRAPYRARRPRVRWHRGYTCDKNRFRRGSRERVSAVLRGHLFVVDQPAPRLDRAGLVPLYRDHQPDLLPGRRHPQPGDHRLGPAGSDPRIRFRPGNSRGRHRRGCGVAQDEGGVGIGGFFDVALAVAGRQVYKYFTNPAFLAPALFPLFFFVAFAGGLTRVADVPGFDYAAGYIAFQYVWALLQAVSMGGAFTGFSIAGDFENGFARRLMLAASNRYGIILGYTIASIVRATMTGVLVTVIALVTGMSISGGFDFFGLVALALLANIAATLFGAGVAMLLRTQQAGPVIRTPIFLLLFLAPVFVPLKLLSGWLEAVARLNPFTHILEAARGFLAGDPTGVASAFTISAILILVLVLWAVYGLRRAERAG